MDHLSFADLWSIVLWSCLSLVLFAYVGYPVLIWLLAKLFGRAIRPDSEDEYSLPTVSILIAAHNEESFISQRIENALALEYPSHLMEVVVASDGSTDRTNELVRQFGDTVRLLDFPERQGKASILNAAIPHVRGEIVILSDANTFFEPNAARRLARWFVDQSVGAVCGCLVVKDPKTGTNADSLYWKYETFLKKCEGRLGGLLGANGAVYAIRRSTYCELPPNTLVDDFVIPLLSKLRHRGRIIYDVDALAYEESPPTVRAEFRRRARIGAGGYQSMVLLWRLLNPKHGWTAFTFFSHKILRWLCPFFLIALLVANVALASHRPYGELLVLQAAFYLTALLAAFLPTKFAALKPLRLATMFVGMNAALLQGFVWFMRGPKNGTWVRTVRLADAAAPDAVTTST
jgi:cellulose synthase/poly-beta-1,6-N-acetylglucosamine synthase-like glycosyltransferase